MAGLYLMLNTPRDSTGKWIKCPENDKKIGEVAVFTKPAIRSDVSNERVLHTQGNLWPTGLFKRQIRTRHRTDIGKTSTRLYSLALILSYMVSALMIAAKITFTITTFFLLRNLIRGDCIDLIRRTLISCFDNDDERSCYSKFKQIFFTHNQAASAYWVSFRLAESGIGDAPHVYAASFPLLLNNPVILLLAGTFTAFSYLFLCHAYNFLIDTMGVAKRVSSKQNPTERHMHNVPAIPS
jgi:hypothetical protein